MTITTRTHSIQVATSNSYRNEHNPRTGGTRLVCDLPGTPDGLPKVTWGQANREIAEFRAQQIGNDYGVRVWVDGRRVDGFTLLYGLDHLNEVMGYADHGYTASSY